MGNPIAHSKSPEIHHAFADQTGQSLTYQRLLVEPGNFNRALSDFRAEGGKGLNVTLPFKLDAFHAVVERTQRAERAGAVNTIWFDDAGQSHGDNTDGIGLVRDLENNAIFIKDKRILILGAGGAVRGVLQPLLDCQPASIVIANRTAAKAEQLVSDFEAGSQLSAVVLDALNGDTFDVIINGTAASLANEMPALPDSLITETSQCYDLAYSNTDTVFVTWAKNCGAMIALDGLGMLVEQAAESFYLWRGVRPETASVIQMLNNQRP